MADATPVSLDGRTLTLTNLDKVLYPATSTTKGEVLDYYARIAPVMVAHTRGRCMTMRRYPDGVDGPSFFEKRCPSHRPEWMPTAVGPGDRKGELRYCRFDEPAAIVWAANLAALELHAPMARSDDLAHPLMCVFDLDPGPGTGSRRQGPPPSPRPRPRPGPASPPAPPSRRDGHGGARGTPG